MNEPPFSLRLSTAPHNHNHRTMALIDIPLPLGEHLVALRKAIVRPVIVFVLAVIVAFAFQVQLKEIMLQPLWQAITLAGDETVQKIGLPPRPGAGQKLFVLALPEDFSGHVVFAHSASAALLPVALPVGSSAPAPATATAAATDASSATRALLLPLFLEIPAGATVPPMARLVRLHGGDDRLLNTMELAESTTSAMKISMIAGLFVTLPYVLYQLWHFVAVGLTMRERHLGFLFFPAGVISFYAGCIAGYFIGLPYFYMFLLQVQALDTTAVFMLRQSEYVDTFMVWTIAFGLICVIPWAVIVLVRVGFVTPEKLSKLRRYVILINLIVAAVITPTGDPTSLMAMFVPMQLFFELGLFLSRFARPKPRAIEIIPPDA